VGLELSVNLEFKVSLATLDFQVHAVCLAVQGCRVSLVALVYLDQMASKEIQGLQASLEPLVSLGRQVYKVRRVRLVYLVLLGFRVILASLVAQVCIRIINVDFSCRC
jgi:hypothetical protein